MKLGICALALVLASIAVARSDEDFDEDFSFVEVLPGDFTMGSDPKGPEKDLRNGDEVPHSVSLTRAYEMAKKEVTRAQWKKIMKSLPEEIEKDGKSDRVPVTDVTWEEATRFAEQLTAELKDGKVYRLPTEAEWEYATRGGKSVSTEERQQPYSSPKPLGEFARYYFNSMDGIQVGGTRAANPLGLYDVHGNVWEWVMDKYVSDTSTVKEDPDFGHPVNLTKGTQRVVRGGCWYNTADHLRSAERYALSPDDRGGRLGFRLVRTP